MTGTTAGGNVRAGEPATAAWGRRVGGVWYSVLGPLAVSAEGSSVGLGGPKQRLVLALLLADVGSVVAADRLIDGVWGDDPPDRARHTLQAYVSELRKVLDDAIDWSGHGYHLSVDPDRVDSVHFERLLAAGRQARPHDPGRAAVLLADALRLWRGEPFSDLRDAPGLQSEIQRLQQLRLTALEERIEADLAVGRHRQLLEELETLTREFPFRERLRAHHMVAAYRCGRQDQALRGFDRTRTFLVEELGVDPSPELRRVHEMILRQDPALEPRVTGPVRVAEDTAAADRNVRGLELRGVIGRTEVTVVHRAYQSSVGREVAVKIIAPEVAGRTDFVRDFEAHTQRVANLAHPHVLDLYDFWRSPDGAFVVMPWARGGSLAQALDGPLTPETARRVVDQVETALAHAHRQGVVHGAIAPSNVLLDEEGNAFLTDFGIVSVNHRPGARPPDDPPGPAEGDPPTVADDVAAFGELARRLLGDEVPPAVGDVLRRATSSAPPTNPYKGLRAFQERDADDFFGRDQDTGRVLELLQHRGLVAVVGPSGSGKSSLVRAGVIPALRSGAVPGSGQWLITDMFPGAYPFEELATALSRVAVERTDGSPDELAADDRGLLRVTKAALPAGDARLLLVIDQFEELFSVVDDLAVRQRFLDSLAVAVSDPRARVQVLLTLRADFFDRPLEHHGFGSLLRAGLVPLTVPSDEGLALAIARPAERTGFALEQGLVAEIVREVKGQAGGLPLMQHALAELAQRPRGTLLTYDAYLETGGVTGALGQRAESLYTSLDAAEQRATTQVFLRLVAVDPAAEDARRRVRRTELAALGIEPRTLERVLERFGEHRLLSFDRDPVTRGATVEVAHEALLTGWERLRGWISERREDLVLHRRLDAAVREWEDARRDPAFLLTGGRLEQFDAWAATTHLSLTDGERALLTVSRAHEDAVRTRSRRRRRGLAAVLSVLTVAAVVLAVVAVDRSRTVQVRSLLSAATANLESDPELALILAIEALERASGPERDAATGVLHETLLRTPVVRSFPGEGLIAWNRQDDLLAALAEGTQGTEVSVRDATSGEEVAVVSPGHGPVSGLAWSHDGRSLAVTHEAGPATVWERATQRVVTEIASRSTGHYFPSFGANDTLLALPELPDATAAGRTREVVVWDLEADRERRRLTLDTPTFGTHLSPVDALLLVSEPETSRASIWDVRTGEKALDLGDQGHDNGFVRFSPDGSRAAVLGPAGVKVWDASTGALVSELDGGRGLLDLEWSPDGALLATAGSDAVVRIFDVATQTELRALHGAGSSIYHLEFGPDGRHVAALWDRIRIWDLQRPNGMEVAAYSLTGSVDHAVWTPDRRRVVTVGSHGDTGVVQVLDAASGTVLGSVEHEGPGIPTPGPRPPPAKVAVGPDGRLVAATVHGTSTLVVDADSLEVLALLEPGGTPAAFSPDSRRLLVGDSQAAYLYDTSTWRLLTTVRNRDPGPTFSWYYDAAFVADRDVVFVVDSSSPGASLAAWDLSDDPRPVVELPFDGGPSMVSVSGDGGRVVAGDVMSGAVRVWDVDTVLGSGGPSAAVVLELDAGDLMPGAVLSHDGSMLVTLLNSGELAIWDVDSGRRRYTVGVPEGAVNEPQLSADGRRLLITSPGVVHELTLDVGELLAIARSRVTRPLTDQECRIYLSRGCPGA